MSSLEHIERWALIARPDAPQMVYSPYGYVIAADGTVLALTHQYYHGVILAGLHPELIEQYQQAPLESFEDEHDREKRMRVQVLSDEIRTDDIDVFAYQNFEHWCANVVPDIRICNTMSRENYFRQGYLAGTQMQAQAARRVMNEHGVKINDCVHTDWGDVKLKYVMDAILLPNDDHQRFTFYQKNNALSN
jgi:hypothetical protein